jgi:transposase
MAAAYSADLRERVVAAYERENLSYREVGLMFGVGEATVDRWVALHRNTGSLAPKPRGGSEPKLAPAQQEKLGAWVMAECDVLLSELRRRVATEMNIDVSESTISRTLKKLGFTLKKSPSSSRHGTRSA